MTTLADLQRQLKVLATDLRQQSETLPKLQSWLEAQYKAAYGKRTGATYETWREEQIDQASVAWLLGTVFVRFCEDNDLIDRQFIAGPGQRTDDAVEAATEYFLQHPTHSDREWIRQAFQHLAGLRATKALFDEHNPVWHWDLSADAAVGLLDFWRRGPGIHDYTDPQLNTRFLGDLYEKLSQDARKRYALLQTPEFVEEFILDLTLDESIKDFGLEATSLIDPTCGSGHFLLGAFHRLVPLWERHHPDLDRRTRAQNVLDQITGVDINPFAVAIARFRLLVEALRYCDEKHLADAPGFTMRLAVGDSLLRWGDEDSSHQGDMLHLLESGTAYPYYTEDAQALKTLLKSGQYTVAVGNPPYITVKDKYLNDLYRGMYDSCSGKYALSVPFAERFFELVRSADPSGRCGTAGQITANSFMKREFGKQLINDFFAKKVELSHIIDTSGAYIPGHGTPTVILVGKRRPPKSPTLRAVLGVQGEQGVPDDPARGDVWSAIADNWNRPQVANAFVTVIDAARTMFANHPWSLAGGGASDLMERIEDEAARRLADLTAHLGIMSVTGEDDLYLFPDERSAARLGVTTTRHLVEGDAVRDHAIARASAAIWPYSSRSGVRPIADLGQTGHLLQRYRSAINKRRRFGTPMVDRGLAWWEWQEVYWDKLHTPFSLTWGEVATHNHFVLDRGGKVFNRTAPVIKLPATATEDDHLALLGLLNSSTACFWLKQVSHDKGIRGEGGGFTSSDWERFFQFNATKLKSFPIPARTSTVRARALDRLAQELAAVRPAAVCGAGVPTRQTLDAAKAGYARIRGRMIALQEELDWEVYWLYGLLDDDLTLPDDAVPELRLGQRAFEIIMARGIAEGEPIPEWFVRHRSQPTATLPEEWPSAYRETVLKRIAVIESRADLALIERPECKRRWSSTPWEVQEQQALRDWLLDRLEAEELWRGSAGGRIMTVGVLADRVGTDADFRSVLALYCGHDAYDLASELAKLVVDETVPFLAAYRYKPSGLVKRKQWEDVWALQRREDKAAEKGERFTEPIPVPPKYAQADFARTSYWRNRGKLDVPKERFVLYPNAGRDTSPVLGWAGWDHLEQAQALANLYMERKQQDGWPKERLLPLLAGLGELEPWLHQWHSDDLPEYGGSPADFYTAFVDAELATLEADRAEIALGVLA
ncbi:BREX-2 system adenine-specific DNA-methyltransferase PglX [Dactylosporangium roseum]|uniref:site-specific DNA-methyltransferase (adenine-specific) n=1 Tax=Dactylosporangium roseum TaxID=47989 RepID=A0ABY5ZHP5_9ACTN|nr:BREX-2 system adenine-specific DNA-methyltransferase PglX [Dactylosporangium roseum]UWZ39779.1 BREX-2 system adenine-specific DNA-methyltransferase PglX [Dactylosporangium roseum]